MAQGVGGYLHSFVVVEGTMSLSNPSLQCCPACHTCPITLQIPRATSHSVHGTESKMVANRSQVGGRHASSLEFKRE
jgi:hypothetical protein